MNLTAFQTALETAPAKMKKIVDEIQAKQKEGKTLEFFLEAVRLLRVSWKDADPGKYTAHWHAFKNGRKAWPRELVDVAAVEAFDDKRIMRHPKLDPTPLFHLHELDGAPCPSCRQDGLEVGCYEQTSDGPDGDTWAKTRYVLCTACVALYTSFAQDSGMRF